MPSYGTLPTAEDKTRIVLKCLPSLHPNKLQDQRHLFHLAKTMNVPFHLSLRPIVHASLFLCRHRSLQLSQQHQQWQNRLIAAIATETWAHKILPVPHEAIYWRNFEATRAASLSFKYELVHHSCPIFSLCLHTCLFLLKMQYIYMYIYFKCFLAMKTVLTLQIQRFRKLHFANSFPFLARSLRSIIWIFYLLIHCRSHL